VATRGRPGADATGRCRQPVGGQVVAAGEVDVQAAGDRGGQRHQVVLAALGDEPQHPVAAVVAELVDVGADELADPDTCVEQDCHDRRGTQRLRAGVCVGGGQQQRGLLAG
jgi:hypothetical protein